MLYTHAYWIKASDKKFGILEFSSEVGGLMLACLHQYLGKKFESGFFMHNIFVLQITMIFFKYLGYQLKVLFECNYSFTIHIPQ